MNFLYKTYANRGLTRGRQRWPIAGAMALVLFQLSLQSCKQFVEIDPPRHAILGPDVFSDSTTATTAMLGVYIQMNYHVGYSNFWFGDGGVTVYTGLSADELYTNTGQAEEVEFFENAVLINSVSNSERFWKSAYTIIYNTNAIIEGLAASESMTISAKGKLIGEAKFMRAYAYFYLANLYSDVPLMVKTDFHENGIKPRSSVDNIYGQIIADLTDAEVLLSASYLTAGRMRPTKLAATALLARVYLYLGRWQEAELAASQVIASANHTLEPNLTNVFLVSSREAIFQLAPVVQNYQTTEGLNFVFYNQPEVVPNYVVSNEQLAAFESADQRKVQWLSGTFVGDEIYYSPAKYKLGYTASPTIMEPYMLLRLAEQYLIRAEARAQQGKLQGEGSAASDLNTIRTRAGLGALTAGSREEMLDLILKERRVELFCEWGHRWLDLKRTGRIDAVLGASKPGWTPTAALFPIPQGDIIANPNLTQNPGYPN